MGNIPSVTILKPVKFPKVIPARRKDAEDKALDRRESAKVRRRSEGRCEVVVFSENPCAPDLRCRRLATQVHHMIGGRGKRGIGLSALAEHKQHVCDTCHRHITGDVGGKTLKRLGGRIPLWTDLYVSVR